MLRPPEGDAKQKGAPLDHALNGPARAHTRTQHKTAPQTGCAQCLCDTCVTNWRFVENHPSMNAICLPQQTQSKTLRRDGLPEIETPKSITNRHKL